MPVSYSSLITLDTVLSSPPLPSPSIPPNPVNAQVFAHVLEQLEPLCATEQEFCIAFFNFTEQHEMLVRNTCVHWRTDMKQLNSFPVSD